MNVPHVLNDSFLFFFYGFTLRLRLILFSFHGHKRLCPLIPGIFPHIVLTITRGHRIIYALMPLSLPFVGTKR